MTHLELQKKYEELRTEMQARTDGLHRMLSDATREREELRDANTRLLRLAELVDRIIDERMHSHPDGPGVRICDECGIAAAGIEHEKDCTVGRLMMARRLRPTSDKDAIRQPEPMP